MRTMRSVGVDFGTTTSLVAEGSPGRQPLVFPLGATTSYLPSLVGLDHEGRMRVGEDAMSLPSDRVRRSIKRCITRNEHVIELADGTPVDADHGITAILGEIAVRARMGGLE